MAPRLPLLKEEPRRSPEREQLQLASARHSALQKHLQAFKDALSKLWGDVQIAKRDTAAAEKEVETAKRAGSAHRVAEALGKDAPQPSSVSDARAQLFDARDRFDELDAAQVKLMQDEAEISSQLEISGIHLRECVAAVVRSDPATTDLVKQLEIARARFCTLQAAADFLSANNFAPPTSPHVVPATMDVENAWRMACAALQSDPDAVLPSDDE